MADNTQVVAGSGDTVRDIDRSANAVAIAAKTQVVQLDAGGQNAESLVSAANPMPVVVAGDLAGRVANILAMQNLLATQAQGTNGFIPMETPAFLVG